MLDRGVAVLCVLFLLTCPTLAKQRDTDLPPPDPQDQWRIVTHESATSQCIGNFKTSLCTIDSALAASLRGDKKLHEQTWNHPIEWEPIPDSPWRWVKYRVVSSGRFKPGDRRRDDRGRTMDWRPNDVWVIVDVRKCESQDNCSGPDTEEDWKYWPARFILHKSGKRWVLIYRGEWHWRQ